MGQQPERKESKQRPVGITTEHIDGINDAGGIHQTKKQNKDLLAKHMAVKTMILFTLK